MRAPVADRPIIFAGSSVRAILAGTKTQTRRLVKGLPPNPVNVRYLAGAYLKCDAPEGSESVSLRIPCPYGDAVTEGLLWVKETWRLTPWAEESQEPAVVVRYEADGAERSLTAPLTWKLPKGGPEQRRSSMFMPRWVSRLTLRIVGVRVQRLWDMTEEDAIAEGVRPAHEAYPHIAPEQRFTDGSALTFGTAPYRATYAVGWDTINGHQGEHALWASNPYVWAIRFEKTGEQRR